MELIYGRMPRHLYGSLKKALKYVDKFKLSLPLELLQVKEKTKKIQLELERERVTQGFREKNPVTFIPGQQIMLHKLVTYTNLGRRYDYGVLTDQILFAVDRTT
jgi:hypothetical protein